MQQMSLLATAAARLLAELMPVSIVLAGPGAHEYAAALAEAGAATDILGEPTQSESFDLAVLLADVAALDAPDTRTHIAALASVSDRLLFVPLTAGDAVPELEALTAWFEPLAELGFQPVVDFDAQFLAPGAFLVDRSATADEADLVSFSDRVSGGQGTAEPERPPQPQQPMAKQADLADEVASLRGLLAQQTATAESLRMALAASETQNAGWDGLRAWAARHVLSEARSLAALRAAGAAYGIHLKRGFLTARRGSAAERALLAEAALLRACPLFDPAWYIASVPELAKSGADPLLHFLLVGGPAGRDPGPWFETAAYVQANPRAASEKIPLLHAIRTGSATPPPLTDEPL